MLRDAADLARLQASKLVECVIDASRGLDVDLQVLCAAAAGTAVTPANSPTG